MRGAGKGYSYSTLFRNWNNVFFCGGECAEDIEVHLRDTLEQIPDNAVPGADSMLRVVKELAVENTEVSVPSSEKVYQFNINEKMNKLNIKLLLLTKQLEKGGCYDFDYDNQIIYIENRDGNANVKTGQAATLERAYRLVEEQEMTINRSRMDAGSYSYPK